MVLEIWLAKLKLAWDKVTRASLEASRDKEIQMQASGNPPQLQPDAKWEWKVTNSQTVKRELPKIQMQINIIIDTKSTLK